MKDGKERIDGVREMDVEPDENSKRMVGRRIHKASRRGYNIE